VSEQHPHYHASNAATYNNVQVNGRIEHLDQIFCVQNEALAVEKIFALWIHGNGKTEKNLGFWTGLEKSMKKTIVGDIRVNQLSVCLCLYIVSSSKPLINLQLKESGTSYFFKILDTTESLPAMQNLQRLNR
jgi:hypothetical protein